LRIEATLGQPFEEIIKTEVDGLIPNGVFEFIKYRPNLYAKSRNEVKEGIQCPMKNRGLLSKRNERVYIFETFHTQTHNRQPSSIAPSLPAKAAQEIRNSFLPHDHARQKGALWNSSV